MQTCPKCRYVRKAVEKVPDWQCPNCGIAYAKFKAAPAGGWKSSRITGHSANELYCLALRQLDGGDLVVGNSVHSMGFIGGITSMISTAFGGEVRDITKVIDDGRHAAFKRMNEEAARHGAAGITGATAELRHFAGNIEFLSLGNCVLRTQPSDASPEKFSTNGDAQALFCMLDAGYTPRQAVFGNVAYSIGLTGGIVGTLKGLARGEIKEYSDIFNHTRHLALERVTTEARKAGANCVVGIVTEVNRFQGVHEMMMLGTAATHPHMPVGVGATPATSDLTCEEMWNATAMGYMPVKLLIASAVYSLGIVGGVKSLLKSIVRGELNDLTTLIYDAREHALDIMHQEADAIGADKVIGVKTHIHEIGSLVEFMAVGTAVKRVQGVKPLSGQLPPQAVMVDRSTWISGAYLDIGTTN